MIQIVSESLPKCNHFTQAHFPPDNLAKVHPTDRDLESKSSSGSPPKVVLPWVIPKLHTNFHPNLCTTFGLC